MKPLYAAIVGLAAALIIATGSGAVRAGCYENVGCTDRDYFSKADLYHLSCQNLDFLRNNIYAERGYCFKKSEYQQLFGNGDCRFDSSDEVPLNRVERHNVSALIAVESEKGCR